MKQSVFSAFICYNVFQYFIICISSISFDCFIDKNNLIKKFVNIEELFSEKLLSTFS